MASDSLTAGQVVSSNVSLHVCPGSDWQSSALLLGREPAAIGTFYNITDWRGADFIDYGKNDVLPGMYANIAFIGLAIITLLFLLFWRLGRCCMQCCCPEDQHKESPDPAAILATSGTWAIKILLLCFSLAAIALCIYGMVTMTRDALGSGWAAADMIVAYFNQVSAAITVLINTFAQLPTVLDQVVQVGEDALAEEYVNLHCVVMGAYLDATANSPTLLASALGTLATQLPRLATIATSVSLSTQTTLPALQASAQSITSFGTSATFTGISSTLSSTLQPALSAISATFVAGSGTGSTAAAVVALQAAMTAATVSTWITHNAAISAALTAISGSTAASAANGDITSLDALVTPMSSSVPATSSRASAFASRANNVLPTVAWLLNQTHFINTTLVRFQSPADVIVGDLTRLGAALTAYVTQAPSTAALKTSLTALTTSLKMPTSTSTLQAYLTTLNSDIAAAPATAAYISYLAQVTAALTALLPAYTVTATALAAYQATTPGAGPQLTALFDSINTPAATTTLALCNSAITAMSSPVAKPTAVMDSWVTTASSIDATLTSASASRAEMATVAASIADRVAAVPGLAGFQSAAQAVADVYSTFPAVQSQELLPLSSQVSLLKAAVADAPPIIEAAVNDAVLASRDAAQELNDITAGKVASFVKEWRPKVDPYVTLRYQVTMGLYAIIILCALLLLFFAGINCRLGLLLALTFLLVFVTLLYILSTLWAAGIIGTNDVCYNMEATLITEVPNQYLAFAAYYIFNYNGGGGIERPLNATGIIDLGDLRQHVLDAQQQIYEAVDTQFISIGAMRGALDDLRKATNGTAFKLEGLVALLGYRYVNPLYTSVKAVLCCHLANEVANMWTAMTYGGWCALLSCWLAMLLVRRLDVLWRYGGRCGWRGVHPRLQWDRVAVAPEVVKGGDGPHVAPQPVGPMDGATPSADFQRPLLDPNRPHFDSPRSQPSYGQESNAVVFPHQAQQPVVHEPRYIHAVPPHGGTAAAGHTHDGREDGGMVGGHAHGDRVGHGGGSGGGVEGHTSHGGDVDDELSGNVMLAGGAARAQREEVVADEADANFKPTGGNGHHPPAALRLSASDVRHGAVLP